MPGIPHDYNTGPSTTTAIDEALIATQENGLVTTVPGNAAGVEQSATDILNADTVVDTDLSLTSGINTDSVFSLAGIDNPLGDLSISGLPSELSNVFGSSFSIDDIAEQFGIGGLLGNLPISINTNVQPDIYPNKNILHNYSSHTYRITLGAQDINDHRQVSDAKFTRGTPRLTSVLMSSGGGKMVDGVCRDEIFKEDFYIEDLKMTTVIGNTAQGNGSNSVGLTFTIYEPYAVSLIERLLALAEKLGYENYIEIPFIFKIEFIGYNDSGDQVGVVPLTTKYIPFRLTYMKFKIDGRGSRYDCTAIPMNHMTYNQTVSCIPEEAECLGGTIGEFFNGKVAPVGDGQQIVGGLVDTVNRFHSKLAETQGVDARGNPSRNAADRIEIIIDPEIAKHRLEVANLSKVGMLNPDTGFTPNRQYPQPAKPSYGFHAGTSILSIIRSMITESTFMTNQIKENERIEQANAANAFSAAEGRGGTTEAQDTNPLIMPKITARYTMLAYDEKANRHAYLATYEVRPFETAGHQSPNISRSEITKIAKEYDYLFTGKNQDILDIDIKFDLAFYNNVATNTESVSEGTPAGNNKKKTGDDQGDGKAQQSDKIMKTTMEARPGESIGLVGSAAREEIKKIKASALMKSVMQDSAGDMITLDMTILGDPAFIKQDDILYATDPGSTDAYTENGSIKQDSGDMYIRLRFKVYDDIDHQTGLRLESRQIPGGTFNRQSTFDGFYRVLMLDNIFQGGKFTQQLTVVRTYTQETDDVESDSNSLLDNSLVSFATDAVNTVTDTVANAQANITNSIASGIGGLIGGGCYSSAAGIEGAISSAASQAVDEAKQLAGDFYAEQTPIDAGEFASVDETTIQNPEITEPVTAESITEISSTQTINADRRR